MGSRKDLSSIQEWHPYRLFLSCVCREKDVNALVVEYEGETYEDRPDREGNDPKYADNVNTRTL